MLRPLRLQLPLTGTAVVVELQSAEEASCQLTVTHVCSGGYQPDIEPRPDLQGRDICVTTKNPLQGGDCPRPDLSQSNLKTV